MKFVKELNDDGVTLIMSCHELFLMNQLAKKAYEIKGGTLHNMERIRLNMQTDRLANRLHISRLNHPFKSVDIDDHFIVYALKGDIADNTGQKSGARCHNIDILGTNDHIDSLVFRESAIDTGILHTGNFHQTVAAHNSVYDIALSDKIGDGIYRSVLR